MNLLKIILLDGEGQTDAQFINILINSDSIFTGRVDLHALIEWFTANEKIIRDSDFPIENSNNYSLAECAYYFYENTDADDSLIDVMYDYRKLHCLRFACRGTNFPDIYIGKNNGLYEISLYTSDEQWRYFFDIDNFFLTLHEVSPH